MSRNEALAGKTVYTNGMNVTYNDKGYAASAYNPDHSLYTGTTKSVKAQDKDSALRGESWTPDYTGLIDWNNGIGMGGGSSSGTDTRAARPTSGTGSAYDAGYGGGYMSAYYDALKAANEAAVQRAIGQLTAQKTTVNDSYDDYARQAYRDKMAAERDIGQYLGARGITGGAAETTILGLSTSYADELRQIEQSRRETLSGLDRAISDARLTGDLNNARAEAEAAKEQAALYAQEMQERKAAAAAREQYELESARNQQSWARTLAAQMLAAGRMPDGATLAAAGLTRAQAELLLPEAKADTEAPEAPAYTPTFTIPQLQTELNNALRYGTSLSPTVLRDYEYYYGAPYGGSGGTTYSAAPASSTGSSAKSSSGTSKAADDYDGLYAAAYASGNPKSYIANHYKEYGFRSVTGLQDGYTAWTQGTYGDYNQRLYGPASSFDALVTYAQKVYSHQKQNADALVTTLRSLGYSDAIIDQVLVRMGL